METRRFRYIVIALALLIGQASAAEMTVIPSSKIVSQGETFYMNISIDPQGAAIAGAQVNIAFDKTIIKVNEITEGSLFRQNGIKTTFFNGGIINNSSGTVINIFDAILGRANVSTPGTFIIINMTAIGSYGMSGINLSNAKISDQNGILIFLNVKNGSITINSPPVLDVIGNKTVNIGKTLKFTLSAKDANGNALTYSASNLPSGATFDRSTRTFSWKPDTYQIGTYTNVRFEVSDGSSIDFEEITINVNNRKRG